MLSSLYSLQASINPWIFKTNFKGLGRNKILLCMCTDAHTQLNCVVSCKVEKVNDTCTGEMQKNMFLLCSNQTNMDGYVRISHGRGDVIGYLAFSINVFLITMHMLVV